MISNKREQKIRLKIGL